LIPDQYYGIHISILCLEIKKAHKTPPQDQQWGKQWENIKLTKCLKWSQYQKVTLQACNKSKTSITSWTQNMSRHDKAKKITGTRAEKKKNL
jgi:hypothetical protein